MVAHFIAVNVAMQRIVKALWYAIIKAPNMEEDIIIPSLIVRNRSGGNTYWSNMKKHSIGPDKPIKEHHMELDRSLSLIHNSSSMA